MKNLPDLILTLGFWSVVLYLFRPSIIGQHDWRDKRVLGLRLLALFLAVSLSFQVDFLASKFDAWIGIPNLSWLLGYVPAIFAGYATAIALSAMANRSLPRWIGIATAITLVGFGLLFLGLRAGPELPHDQFPKTTTLLVFRELLYAYMFLAGACALVVLLDWQMKEKLPTGRLRGLLALISCSSGMLFLVLRGTASLVDFFLPGWSLEQSAFGTTGLLISLSIATMILCFVPLSWLQLPARGLIFLDQILTLRELRALRARLVAVTGAVLWSQPSSRESLRNPPYALYCTLIDILDRRMLLLASVRDKKENITEAHVKLAALLEVVPDTKDWAELLGYIRGVARQAERI